MAAEVIQFEINPQSVIKAISDMNASIQNYEKGATSSNDKLNQSFQRVADILLKVNDRSRNSMESLTRSIEKQAAAYGKTPIDKLIAARDQHIKRLGDEESMVKRVTAAYQKMIAAEQQRQESNKGNPLAGFSQQFQNIVQNPASGAGSALTSFLEKLGPMGVALSATGAAAVATGAAIFEMTKNFAESAQQLQNLSAQTGIQVDDLSRLQAMAKLTGTDIGALARGATQMAATLDEGGEKAQKMTAALARIGVSTVQFNGAQKDEGALLQETLEALSKVTDTTQRLALAAETLGPRTSKSIAPLLSDFNKLKETVEQYGFGQDKILIQKGAEAAQKLHEMGLAFERVESFVAVGAIGFVDWGTKAVKSLTDVEAKITGLIPGFERLQRAMGIGGDKESAPASSPYLDAYKKYEDIQKQLAQVSALRFVEPADNQKQVIEDQIKAQNKKRGDALTLITGAQSGSGLGLDAERRAEQDVRLADQKLKSLKDQLDVLEKQKSTAEALAKYLAESRQREANPYQSPADKRFASLINDHPGMSSQQFGQAQSAYITENTDWFQKLKQSALTRQQEQAKKIVEEASKEASRSMTLKGDEFVSDNRRADERSKQDLGIGTQYLKYDAQDRLQQQIGSIQMGATLSTDPQAKLKAELQILEVRKNNLKEIYDYDVDLTKSMYADKDERDEALKTLRIKNTSEVHQLELQQQQELAEESRREFEEIKSATTHLYDTLFTHPKDFGKQLQDTLKQAAMKPVVDQMSNMTASILQPVIFGGKGGGQNPVIGATNQNTHITAQNTSALERLTAAFAGGGGGSRTVYTSSGGFSGGGGGFSIGNAFSDSGGSLAGGDSSSGGGSDSGDYFADSPWLTQGGPSPNGGGDGGGYSGSGGGAGSPFTVPPGGGRFNPSPLLSSAMGLFKSGGGGGQQGGGGRGFNLGSLFKGGGGGGDNGSGGGGGFKWSSLGSFSRKDTGTPGDDNDDGSPDGSDDGGGAGGINGVNGPAGAALMAGGMWLGEKGLLGKDRGTGAGILEGAGGGAMIGFKMGGPLGAAIGAGVGLSIGVGEKLAGVESPQNKIKRLAKQNFGVTLQNPMVDKLYQLAQSKYMGNIDMMMQSPEVRSQLMLYAAGTGQKMPMSSQPMGASLQEQGGQLQQNATYKYGQAYSYSSSLPVSGGLSSSQLSIPGGGNSPTSLSLSIDGKGAGDFMAGNVVTSDFVQSQYAASQQYSNGRVDGSAMVQQPGLITS